MSNKYEHPFLDDDACTARLIEEYQKNKELYVAYDFDNTVFDFHHKGYQFTEIIELLRELSRHRVYLIVFTAADDIDEVRSFLVANNIPFNSINENPPFFKGSSRKIYYNILLDDRAGLYSAFKQLHSMLHHITTNNIS